MMAGLGISLRGLLWICMLLLGQCHLTQGGRYSDPAERNKLIIPSAIAAAIFLLMLILVLVFITRRKHCQCGCGPQCPCCNNHSPLVDTTDSLNVNNCRCLSKQSPTHQQLGAIVEGKCSRCEDGESETEGSVKYEPEKCCNCGGSDDAILKVSLEGYNRKSPPKTFTSQQNTQLRVTESTHDCDREDGQIFITCRQSKLDSI